MNLYRKLKKRSEIRRRRQKEKRSAEIVVKEQVSV